MNLHGSRDLHESTRGRQLRNVDQICDRFEAAWRAGLEPRIEDYFEDVSEQDRPRLLRELVTLEVLCRKENGQLPAIAEYEISFPSHREVVREAFECCTRCRATANQTEAVTSLQRSPGSPSREYFPRGTKIGRYIVQEPLGEGAFSIVYLACDEKLQRAVAIKIPRRDSGIDPALFLKEAQTAAKLTHPSIVSVYDTGQMVDGVPFVVMEYVAGTSLKVLLAKQRVAHGQLAKLFAQIAVAIHHAHTRRIVHRDLKPANIIIDKFENPHIVDLGLALHETCQREHRGDVSGTPLYQSPEQVRGEAHWIDGRCDIWAVGVMLYESLTGRHPFQNHDEIQFRAPRPLRQIDDKIPDSLERICLKCLAKSVEQRYYTADSLARELQRACDELTTDPATELTIRHDETGNAIISAQGNVVVLQEGTRALANGNLNVVKLGPNPYKGLLAYEEADAQLFFGREEQTRLLWDRLRLLVEQVPQDGKADRVLPILGASGCGKSSLVRAGLISELARRPLPGWQNARVILFIPGVRPLERLARVLAQMATADPAAIETQAAAFERLMLDRREGDGLRRIVDLMPESARSPLILVVDQLEEIYCLCRDTRQRTVFLENLLHATSDSSGEIALVFTLRCDFLGAAQDHRQLNRLISDQGFIVPALTEAQLRRIITEPARRMGYAIEPALVDLLIEQTRDRDGALPLLQFALARIWEGVAKGGNATEILEKLGGVGGALAGEADRIYSSLTPSDQQIARRAFMALVHIGEGTRDTRRQVTIDEVLAHGDDPAHVYEVMDRFARPEARLITLSGKSGAAPTAQVCHEALFDHWQQLKDWIARSRDDIRFQRRLEQAARHWDVLARSSGLLWRAPDLDALREFQQRNARDMTPLQLNFLTASNNQEQKEKSALRRRTRLYQSALAIFAMLVLALVFLSLLYRQQGNYTRRQSYLGNVQLAYAAWQERDLTRTRELLTKCTTALGDKQQPDFAWEYLWNKCQVLEQCRQDEDFTFVHKGPVTALALSNDGQRLAAGGLGEICVWNAKTGALNWQTSSLSEPIRLLAMNGDGSYLVSAGGSLRLWNIADGTFTTLPNAGANICCLALSADGHLLATGHDAGVVTVWDIRSHEKLVNLGKHPKAIRSVAFSPDGQMLASGDVNEGVRLWDVSSGEQLAVLTGTTAAFAPDGHLLAAAGRNCFIQLWDISDRRKPKPFPGIKMQGTVRNLAFANNNLLLLAYDTGKWDAYDFSRGEFVGNQKGGSRESTVVAFSRDGTRVAAATYDTSNADKHFSSTRDRTDAGTIRLWQVNIDAARAEPATTTDWLMSAVLIQDGKALAMATGRYSPPFESSSGTACRVMIETGDRIALPNEHASQADSIHWLCVASSPDNSYFACGGFRVHAQTGDTEGIVALYSLRQPSSEPAILLHDDWVRSVAFSPDGGQLAVGSRLGPVVVWNVQDLRSPRKLATLKTPAWSVAFSPDGRILAAGGGTWSHGKIALEDIKELRTLASLDEPAGLVTSVVFFPDGETLVAADYGGNITFYNSRLQTRTKLLAHNTAIRALALTSRSRSRTVLASGGLDGLVKLWDVATVTQLGSLSNKVAVYSLSFSDDGRALAAGKANGTVTIWRTNGTDCLFAAR